MSLHYYILLTHDQNFRMKAVRSCLCLAVRLFMCVCVYVIFFFSTWQFQINLQNPLKEFYLNWLRDKWHLYKLSFPSTLRNTETNPCVSL